MFETMVLLMEFCIQKGDTMGRPPLFSGTQTGHFFANKNHEPGDEMGYSLQSQIWWFALQLWTTCLLLMLLMGIQSHFDTLIGGSFFCIFITFVACCGYEVLWMYYGWNAAPVDRWLVYPIIISSFLQCFKGTH